MLEDLNKLCNYRISDDIGKILQFNGFYFKKWFSYEADHIAYLNLTLCKPIRITDYTRIRPDISDTHTEMQIMLKTTQNSDPEVIEADDNSLSQLGRILTRHHYSVKTKFPSYAG